MLFKRNRGKSRVQKAKEVSKMVLAYALAVSFGASSVINYYEGGKLLEAILTDSKVVYSVHAEEEPKHEETVPEVIQPARDCHEAIERTDGPSELMKRISDAEATNDPHAKSKVSTASGCFQFVNASWNQYGLELWEEDFYQKNVFDPQDNADLAAYVINTYGTSPWEASRASWGK